MSFFARVEFQAADSKTQGHSARGSYECRSSRLKLDPALAEDVENGYFPVGANRGGVTKEGGEIGFVAEAEKSAVSGI